MITDKKYIKRAVKRLHAEIPNLSEFYTDEEAIKIVKNFDESTKLPDVSEEFMEAVWDQPMRRCTMCGKLMKEGYLLAQYYACSDECRNDYYKDFEGAADDEEAYKMYIKDCHELDDEDLEGLTAEEAEEKFADYEIGDDVFWTTWE